MPSREIAVHLPHPVLPDADWADGWEIESGCRLQTAYEAAEIALNQSPLWVRSLMKLRDILVTPFGLKTSERLKSVRFILNQTDFRLFCSRLSFRENRFPLFPDKL